MEPWHCSTPGRKPRRTKCPRNASTRAVGSRAVASPRQIEEAQNNDGNRCTQDQKSQDSEGLRQESPVDMVSFPYDAMVADCLGIERLPWKEESRVLSNGTGANSPNSVKDVSGTVPDMVSMDLFDLSPSALKHSNSLMAIGDMVDDDFCRFGVEKDLDIDYSSETSDSSQGSLLCAAGDDESQLWDCCY